jgi:hypothetical protein
MISRKNKAKAYTLAVFKAITCKLTSRLKQPNVLIIILTKSFDENKQVRRACVGYKNNEVNVSICIVESGIHLPDLPADYYFKPEIPFHYNLFIRYALDRIDITRFDSVVISNDDVIPHNGAVDSLLFSGFDSCSPIDPSCIRWKNVKRPTIGYSIEYHLNGWCLHLSSAVLARLGPDLLFHDRYNFNAQDIYYSKLLEAAGVIHAVVPHSKVIHLEHQSHELVDSSFLDPDDVLKFVDCDVEESIRKYRMAQT